MTQALQACRELSAHLVCFQEQAGLLSEDEDAGSDGGDGSGHQGSRKQASSDRKRKKKRKPKEDGADGGGDGPRKAPKPKGQRSPGGRLKRARHTGISSGQAAWYTPAANAWQGNTGHAM